MLETRLKQDESVLVIYLDARVLGSTSRFTDPATALSHRCICLFRDILGEIFNPLHSWVINNPPTDSTKVLQRLDELGRALTQPVQKYSKGKVEVRSLGKTSSGASAGLSITPSEAGFELGASNDQSEEKEAKTSRDFVEEDKIVFPVFNLMKEIIELCGIRLYLLVDE